MNGLMILLAQCLKRKENESYYLFKKFLHLMTRLVGSSIRYVKINIFEIC